MRPLVEAQAEILDTVRRLPVRSVGVDEAAGLALAEAVVAGHDIPPFPNSAMDGYAVRSGDLAGVPVDLAVLEDVPAGSVPTLEVAPGTAIKIMTGATIPKGADTIVPVEVTEALGGEKVRVHVASVAGEHVRPAGGDVAAGTEVFPAGVRLGPAHLAVLASIGARPRVGRRPVVAIMSTGDEVVPADTEALEPGKIRDTNRVLLRNAVAGVGATVVDYGIVGDDAEELHRALAAASSVADLVVTSGGVSMGEYDLVKQVLGDLGTVDFWQVAMQPGKPFAFGTVGGTPLFGLPGNPVSVFVAFEQFVRPAILSMMGSDRLFRSRFPGVLGEAVDTNPEKVVFVRVRLDWSTDGTPVATSSGGQSSNVLSALALADALAVVPTGVGVMRAGAAIDLEMFRWPEGRTREDALGG